MSSTPERRNRSVRERFARLAAGLVPIAFVALGGCSSLLPKAESRVEGPWASYEEARAAIERLKPYETTRDELHAAGFDPYTTPSITILTYSDLLQRFAAGSALRAEDLDPGILDCLRAGKLCEAYLVNQRVRKLDRNGNFWLDSLQFNRVTDVTGWSFNALVVIVRDKVVYSLQGGEPRVKEKQTSRNPLGPLQGWGDAAAAAFF